MSVLLSKASKLMAQSEGAAAGQAIGEIFEIVPRYASRLAAASFEERRMDGVNSVMSWERWMSVGAREEWFI
jgi:hypothetical protein